MSWECGELCNMLIDTDIDPQILSSTNILGRNLLIQVQLYTRNCIRREMLTNLTLICTFLTYYYLITPVLQTQEIIIILHLRSTFSSVSQIFTLFSHQSGLHICSLHTITYTRGSAIHKTESTFSIKQIIACCGL